MTIAATGGFDGSHFGLVVLLSGLEKNVLLGELVAGMDVVAGNYTHFLRSERNRTS